MKFAIALATLLASLAIGLVTVALPASASSRHATPASRTCAAFRTWNRHQTPANLNALMRASINAPWNPLGTDVVVLYTDARNHDTYDLADDTNAVRQDCRR